MNSQRPSAVFQAVIRKRRLIKLDRFFSQVEGDPLLPRLRCL